MGSEMCIRDRLSLIEMICARSDSTVLYVNHHAEDSIAGVENHLALDG